MANMAKTFEGQLWFADKTRPKAVPAVFKVEVQPPLLAETDWTFTCYYWWNERSHRVDVKVHDRTQWKDAAASELGKHFERLYPDDAANMLEVVTSKG